MQPVITLGEHAITSPVFLAPMAGITDLPFRHLCLSLGAGLATTEMISSNPALRNTKKSKLRLHPSSHGPFSVQIAGGDPESLADAARHAEQLGADIIDINMGCPAKKVCNKAAGSALLKNEALVQQILESVIAATSKPVTLKIRTGWDKQSRNGVQIAEIAAKAGVKMLTIHGRTKACRFNGHAEYDTIKQIKQAVDIPIIANGDITSSQQALDILDYTEADGVMIGRGAQGQPWIFQEISHYLHSGTSHIFSPQEKRQTFIQHIHAIHQFYDEHLALRISRKHAGWYFQTLDVPHLRQPFNIIQTTSQQKYFLDQHLMQPSHSSHYSSPNKNGVAA